MTVFIDTNVILDYVLRREHYAEAKETIVKLVAAGDKMLMSVGGFYTMLFLVDKYFRKDLQKGRAEARELTRNIMRKFVKTFSIAEHDAENLLAGVDEIRFKDIEDSCQYQLAKKCCCDLFITFNTSDFPEEATSEIRVVSPIEFML